MIKKLLAALAAIGGVFSAIFFVLFKQSKLERAKENAEHEADVIQAEKEKVTEVLKKEQEIVTAAVQEAQKNEEDIQRINGNPTLDAYNASISKLQELARNGNKRNSTGNTGN